MDDLMGLGSYGFGSNRTEVDLSVWTGVKLGIGWAIGVALVMLLLFVVVILVFHINVTGFAS